MNAVFIAIVVIAFVVAALTSSMETVSQSALDGAANSVTLAISLIGYMALFLGLMKVAEDGGLLRILARAIRPIMVRLFPDVPPEHPAMGAMIMNIAANMLGLTNAATPLGIKAMMELNKINKRPGVASNAMVLFLAINTSGLALLPTGVVGLRAAFGSTDPWGIMASTLAATGCATVVGILAAKGLQRLPIFAMKEPDHTGPAKEVERSYAVAASELVQGLMKEEKQTSTTWGVWVLRIVLLAMLAVLAGPPLVAVAIGEDERPDTSVLWQWEKAPIKGSWEVVEAPPSSEVSAFEDTFEPDATGDYRLEESCEDEPCATKALRVEPSLPYALRHASEIIGDWVIPVLILSLVLFGWARGVKVYESFVKGAKEGFTTGVMIIPYLVAILVAVGMFRGSGAMTWLTGWMGIVTEPLGVPPEVLPMALVRPLSGSGAFGLMVELLQTHGPDSYIGYLASTMQGSTDTTFYVLAVYFGAVGVSKTRHAVLAGLSADLAGFLAAAIVCALLFGHLA